MTSWRTAKIAHSTRGLQVSNPSLRSRAGQSSSRRNGLQRGESGGTTAFSEEAQEKNNSLKLLQVYCFSVDLLGKSYIR